LSTDGRRCIFTDTQISKAFVSEIFSASKCHILFISWKGLDVNLLDFVLDKQQPPVLVWGSSDRKVWEQ
jgi:hypothetical protein